MSKSAAIKSISFLWVSALLGAACAFINQVVISRALSPEGLGFFASILAFVNLFVPLVGFGVAQYWLREFGKSGWGAVGVIRPSLLLILVNLSVSFFVLLLLVFFWGHRLTNTNVLVIMSMFILGQVCLELVSSKLQLEERYNTLAVWQLFPQVLRLLLVGIVVFIQGTEFNVLAVAVIFAVVSLVTVILSIKSLIGLLQGGLRLKGHGSRSVSSLGGEVPAVGGVLKGTWAFGLASVFHLIYFQSDIILVKYMVGDQAAGFYNVAFTVMVAVLILPGIVYQKFLMPKMHRWANHDRETFYRVYKQGNLAMLVLGGLTLVFIWLFMPVLVPALFGSDYDNSVGLLKILSLSIPFLFVASSVGAVLVTQEHMKLKVKLMGFVALVNMVLNLVLVPSYGAEGASVATVLSNIFLLFLYYYAAKKYVF